MSNIIRIGMSGGNDELYKYNLQDHDKIDIEENRDNIYRRSGKNLGNIVWAFAMRKIFKNAIFTEIGARQIDNNEMDIIVLAMANIFRDSERNEKLALSMYNRLKNTNIPIIVLSVGCQNNNTRSILRLGPNCKLFLKLLNDKCDFIGVRGEYTKRVFIKYGVHADKILITGCPSIFLNNNIELGNILKTKFTNITGEKIIFSLPGYTHTNYMCRKMLKDANKDNNAANIQSGILVEGHYNKINKNTKHKIYKEIFENSGTNMEVETFYNDHLSAFNDVPNWHNYLKDFDMGISARIHGGIMMLMSEVPSIIIAIDSRVKEMCDTFKLPYIDPSDYINNDNKDLFDKIVFDGNVFDNNRKLLAERYKKIFDHYNLCMSEYITNFL
jgi:hypothetical protein